MNYTTTINKVIDYIEENLEEKLELKQLAEIANISPYHFHRVFSRETGEKVNDYIIRRRLTQASFDLHDTDDSLINISLRYGFDSPQSFSRSFKKLFKQSPLNYRKGHIVNIDVVTTQINYSGEEIFKYKIIEKGELNLAGYEITIKNHEKELTEISFLFDQIYDSLNNKELIPIENAMYMYLIGERVFLGVPACFTYNLNKNIVKQYIPPKKYIVFEHKAPVDKTSMTFDKIFNKWLPTLTNLKVDDSFILERFDENDHPHYFQSEIPGYEEVKIKDYYSFKNSFCYEIFLPLKE